MKLFAIKVLVIILPTDKGDAGLIPSSAVRFFSTGEFFTACSDRMFMSLLFVLSYAVSGGGPFIPLTQEKGRPVNWTNFLQYRIFLSPQRQWRLN